MSARSTGIGRVAGRAVRLPMAPRHRRRWLAAAALLAGWLVLVVATGSALAATILLVVLAALAVVVRLGLQALGITRDHPWLRRLAERPWRDGEDVLRVALRHLPDVFVVTPSGSLIAPDIVELRMNPGNLESLAGRMDPGLVMESATEVYADQVAARGARLAGHVPPQVRVFSDASVPRGRFLVRQGQPVDGGRPAEAAGEARGEAMGAAAGSAGAAVGALYQGFVGHDGGTREYQDQDRPGYPAQPQAEPGRPWAPPGDPGARTQHQVRPAQQPAGGAVMTVAEQTHPQVPVLRLVTGSSVTQTQSSGARAGRGDVELRLPEVPTVSREHARFTFSGGRWWIANMGRNGLTLNGSPLSGRQPLEDGDVIRWGMKWNALLSRVEIG